MALTRLATSRLTLASVRPSGHTAPGSFCGPECPATTPMMGRGTGVDVGGMEVEAGPTRVAMAIAIAPATSEGRSDEGDHMVKTVAEARATRTTIPICRT